MRSKPEKSLWGLSKTRCELHSRRLDRAISRGRGGNPKLSPIPTRIFNQSLQRFSDNWS